MVRRKAIKKLERNAVLNDAVYGAKYFLEAKKGYRYFYNISTGPYSAIFRMAGKLKEDAAGECQLAVKCSTDANEIELETWRDFQHQNVVKLLGTYIFRSFVIFIMPLYKADLWSVCHARTFYRDPCSFLISRVWCQNIMSALVYFHGKKLAHLNLKLENIFVKENGQVCVGDFSLMKTEVTANDQFLEFHRPPEFTIVGYPDLNISLNGPAVDMWQYGILVVELLTDRKLSIDRRSSFEVWAYDIYPFIEKLTILRIEKEVLVCPHLRNKLKRRFEKSYIDNDDVMVCREFLLKILKLNPEDRLSANTALDLEFIHPDHAIWPETTAEDTSEIPIVYKTVYAEATGDPIITVHNQEPVVRFQNVGFRNVQGRPSLSAAAAIVAANMRPAAPVGTKTVQAPNLAEVVVPRGTQVLQTVPRGTQVLQAAPRGTQVLQTAPRGTQVLQAVPRGTQVLQTVPRGTQVLQTVPRGTQVLHTVPRGTQVLQTVPRGTQVLQTAPRGTQVLQVAPASAQAVVPRGTRVIENVSAEYDEIAAGFLPGEEEEEVWSGDSFDFSGSDVEIARGASSGVDSGRWNEMIGENVIFSRSAERDDLYGGSMAAAYATPPISPVAAIPDASSPRDLEYVLRQLLGDEPIMSPDVTEEDLVVSTSAEGDDLYGGLEIPRAATPDLSRRSPLLSGDAILRISAEGDDLFGGVEIPRSPVPDLDRSGYGAMLCGDVSLNKYVAGLAQSERVPLGHVPMPELSPPAESSRMAELIARDLSLGRSGAHEEVSEDYYDAFDITPLEEVSFVASPSGLDTGAYYSEDSQASRSPPRMWPLPARRQYGAYEDSGDEERQPIFRRRPPKTPEGYVQRLYNWIPRVIGRARKYFAGSPQPPGSPETPSPRSSASYHLSPTPVHIQQRSRIPRPKKRIRKAAARFADSRRRP